MLCLHTHGVRNILAKRVSMTTDMGVPTEPREDELIMDCREEEETEEVEEDEEVIAEAEVAVDAETANVTDACAGDVITEFE